MTPPPRFNVLGVGVHALTLDRARDRIIAAAREGPSRLVCCCDVNSVCSARRDARHRAILNRAFLTTPDGMPLVWLGRRAGHTETKRVYGPDLLLALTAATTATGDRHYFCGAGPGTADLLAATLRARFPGLMVAGTESPPFGEISREELDAIAARIRAAKADFIWIGLSTPRQEALMAALQPRLTSGVLLGVGAAFDLLSGRIRQAPTLVRQSGFEWLWRLVREPRRLGPRYLRNGPLFLGLIASQLSGMKRFPVEE
jgi:N-acetylglucosaminyldiphosphoundecaprenol N-acetyl-beta-D-mannosaminyltransferase